MRALRQLWIPTGRLYDRADEGQPRRFVLDCGIAWQNYRDDAGVFQEIDLTPEVVAGGLRVRKVPYDLTLLTTGERRIAPDRAFAATRFIRFPANRFLANKTFTRVGNSLVWQSNAYDVVLRWENSRVKFDVVLKRNVPFDSVSFDVDKTGIDDAALLSFLTNLKAIDSSIPEPIVRPLSVSLVAGVLTLGFDLTGMAFPVTIDPTLDLQVGATADDGQVRRESSAFNATAAILVGTNYGTYDTWKRFTGVSGLSGATIDVAYVSIYGDYGAGTPLYNIYGEDAEAPTAPTTYADYTGRTVTTAFVAWDVRWTQGIWNNSPSINSIIQELADSYNPTVIQIFFKDDGSASGANYALGQSYDQDTTQAPKLHIEYTAGAAGRIMGALAGHGGLAGAGGIAGKRGGLAA